MNEIKIFENPKFGKVRTKIINGEIWFVGKDVAEALGYTNPQKAVRDHVLNEDRGLNEMDTPSGKQRMTLINESGLYALIFGSKLESAAEFKRWITSEVLPSLRKIGTYSMEGQDSYIINDPVKRAERWIEEEKERRRLAQENQNLLTTNKKLNKNNEDLKKENSGMKPKAKFHDLVARSSVTKEEAISVGQLAGILSQNNGTKIGSNRLFEFLRRYGYLCEADHVWNKPKQNMIERGYMLYKEGWDRRKKQTTFQPLITGKGQVLIAKRVSEHLDYFDKSKHFY